MSQHSRAIGLLFALTSIVALTIVLSITPATTAARSTSDWPAPAVPSAVSAQVVLSPTATGGFGSPNTPTVFQLRIDNLSASADTFDLLPSSPWPMTFYRLDGITPLTDTDGDGAVDTGLVIANWYAAITVKITPPANATIGQYANSTLNVHSSNDPSQSALAAYNVAIPAPFAQSNTQHDRPYVSVSRFWLKTRQQTTAQFGYEAALTTAPDGSLIQAWEQGRTNGNGKKVYELFSAAFDGQGNMMPSPMAVTDLSSATSDTHDHQPAIAVAPNGNLGILWYRTIKDSSGNFNYNVYFTILNSSGGVVLFPTDLTGNIQWGASTTPNVPQFFEPIIGATPDQRFLLAWRRQLYTGSTTRNTLWIAVRDTLGGVVNMPAQFSSNTCSYHPHLTPLADGSVFLVYETCANVTFARLNSGGALLNNPIALTTANGNDSPVAAQLTNGNILMAWQHNFGSRFALQYAMLSSALNMIKSPTDLPSISPAGDKAVSATRSGDKAVLTWTDVYTYQPNLYYALLDNTGQAITPPLIVTTDPSNALSAVGNGQGNTYLITDLIPPSNPSTLTSPDHLINQWSSDNAIDVTWSGASDNGSSGLAGYSIGWDANPSGLPDAIRDLAAAVNTTTSPSLSNGTWYFHLRTLDNDGNAAATAMHLGPFKIDTALPKSSAYSPTFAVGSFNVAWSGTDTGSGIASYNVWVRDGLAGGWTKWLTNTTATSATFAGGVANHAYYFRSEARDIAGNVETDLPSDGDTHTTVAAFQIDGQIVNNRHTPIFNATISAQPPALNSATSDGHGHYALYFVNSGAYTLTVNRYGFGVLPPRYNLTLNNTQTGFDFVLPPLNDALSNGGWEAGDTTGWQVDPPISTTIELTAAHTGWYGLHLDAPLTGAESMPSLTQTLTVTAMQPTLSFLYQVTHGNGDPFVVAIMTDTSVITHGFVVTPGNWTHEWIDLSAFASQTVTLTLGFQNPAATQQIYLDEISLGNAQVGVYPVYLPMIRHN